MLLGCESRAKKAEQTPIDNIVWRTKRCQGWAKRHWHRWFPE
jgi:hypothetical protein